jgi:thiamine biosynthesis lipoprotein
MPMKLLVIVVLALLAAACARNPIYSQESYVFGTRVEVLVWGVPEHPAREAVSEVLREFDRLHRTYHAWQPSEMTALNEAIAAGRHQQVTREFAGLIRDAQLASAKGEYLFDPGIGGLVTLWGFHDDTFKAQLPDADKLRELVRRHPSVADLVVDDLTVSSSNAAVALDFGGYLKGVALDRAAAILKGRGIGNALINIGGNVMALGSKGGVAWRVGIQHPRQTAPLATLELRDGEAIGTSGDYQRYFEVDGKRYCHLIDPRDGRPASATQAVTVLMPPGPHAGMWSDVASKPLFIAGADWRRLAEKQGVSEVLHIDATGSITLTDSMKARVTMAGQ